MAQRTASAAELQRTILHQALTFSQGELGDDLTLVVVASADERRDYKFEAKRSPAENRRLRRHGN